MSIGYVKSYKLKLLKVHWQNTFKKNKLFWYTFSRKYVPLAAERFCQIWIAVWLKPIFNHNSALGKIIEVKRCSCSAKIENLICFSSTKPDSSLSLLLATLYFKIRMLHKLGGTLWQSKLESNKFNKSLCSSNQQLVVLREQHLTMYQAAQIVSWSASTLLTIA